MKRAIGIKRSSVRCSEEPVGGDGSLCAVSITNTKTKRAKVDPAGADVAGITKKRPRKPDKPSKNERRAEEEEKKRNKRSKKKKKKKKKRAEEKKRSKQEMRTEEIASKLEEEEVASDGINKEKRTKMAAACPENSTTTKLSQELLDYLRTKEVMGLLATEAPLPLWAKRMGGALFELDLQSLKEEIAAEFHESREFDAHVLYQYRTTGDAYAETTTTTKGTETEEKKKKKKLVTQEINHDEMGPYLSEEIWRYVMNINMVTFEECVIREIEMYGPWDDPSTEDTRLATRRRGIENQANLLRQYRTSGHAVLQVTDDERDVEDEV